MRSYKKYLCKFMLLHYLKFLCTSLMMSRTETCSLHIVHKYIVVLNSDLNDIC
jgi:hypothetical protein